MKNYINFISSIISSAFILVIVYGYSLNIYKLSHCDFNFSKSSKAEIFRIVGIITPMGCVIGYTDFSDEEGDM